MCAASNSFKGVERSDRLLDTIILSANLLNQEIGVKSAEKAVMIKSEVLLRKRAKELKGK